MAFFDIEPDRLQFLFVKILIEVEPNLGEELTTSSYILKTVSDRLISIKMTNVVRQTLANEMSVDGLKRCLEGGEYIFVGVTHKTICELGVASGFDLFGQLGLPTDNLDLASEMNLHVDRATVRTIEPDRVYTVVTLADIANEIAQQIFANCNGARFSLTLGLNLYGGKPALRKRPIEVMRPILKVVTHVLADGPINKTTDCGDILACNEVVVSFLLSAIGTNRFPGTWSAACAEFGFLIKNAILRSVPELEETWCAVLIRTFLIHLASRTLRCRNAKCPSGDFMSRMNRLSGGPS